MPKPACSCPSERRLSVGPAVTALGSAAPAIGLGLLPKCPACLAAYVAVWTGFGLSAPVAAHARTALLVVCVASVALLAMTIARRRRLGRHDR